MTRRDDALDYRIKAAQQAHDRPHPQHGKNGDETAYAAAHHPMNFTKGLRHDPETGLVAEAAHFAAFRKAIDDGFVKPFTCDVPVPIDPADLGAEKRRRWEAPTAGFVFELQGPDAQAVTMAPAPALGNVELAYEMAEVYELALLRDKPFRHFSIRTGETVDADIAASVSRLTQIATRPNIDLGPQPRRRTVNEAGEIDAQTAFRGSSPGCEKGPYLSQFMLIGDARLPDGSDGPDAEAQMKAGHIRYGAQTIDQRVWVAPAGKDYMTEWEDWLAVQNGGDVRKNRELFAVETTAPQKRFIATPRDLATYVHDDALYQAYLNACLILLAMDAPLDPCFDHFSGSAEVDCGCGEPKRSNVTGFALFGGPHILSLVTEVATRGLKAVRFQKFQNHLRLRPEALAARIHMAEAVDACFPDTMKGRFTCLRNAIEPTVEAIRARNSQMGGSGAALLPMAFQEGSPMHPSYGAGHATVAGACVTVLKAFFDTDAVFVRPKAGGAPRFKRYEEGDQPVAYEAQPNGDALVEHPMPQGHMLTLEGELNKLAANISIGRNMAGVHYYCDYYDSARMGEEIAIGVLQEQAPGYPKDAFVMKLRTFDGEDVTIGDPSETNAPDMSPADAIV